MFVGDGLELSWMVGGVRHVLRIGGDGRPELVAPGTGGEAIVPANAGMARGRRGRAWSPTEEQELSSAFSDGLPLPDIAGRLGRSTTAVQARLVLLGLLDPAEATLRYPLRPPAPKAVPNPDEKPF
jgi:hypothetical protein